MAGRCFPHCCTHVVQHLLFFPQPEHLNLCAFGISELFICFLKAAVDEDVSASLQHIALCSISSISRAMSPSPKPNTHSLTIKSGRVHGFRANKSSYLFPGRRRRNGRRPSFAQIPVWTGSLARPPPWWTGTWAQNQEH